MLSRARQGPTGTSEEGDDEKDANRARPDGRHASQTYDRLVAAWDAASGVSASACAADLLREGLRISLDDLTALSFMDATIYPHEQSQYDVAMRDAAIASVKAGDWGAAQDAVGGVDLNGLALYLSHRGFLVEQLHHDPTYANISWGAQGQLSEPIDLRQSCGRVNIGPAMISTRPGSLFTPVLSPARAGAPK